MMKLSLTDMQQSVKKLVDSSEISTQRIQEGGNYTNKTTVWLKEIINGATKTTEAAQDISASIQQQQHASEEISAALKEISSSIAQFAEAGTSSRDTASQLNALAENLKETIKVLKC